MNQKSLTLSHQALIVLAQNCDVRCLGTLGSFFNNEFNFLAFGQVTETVTLNGGEMDEHVRSTFALDKAEALVTIEPLYCTSYTIRHFLPPLAIEKNIRYFVHSIGGQNKTAHEVNRELVLFFKPT
jgi:hypothetical protein